MADIIDINRFPLTNQSNGLNSTQKQYLQKLVKTCLDEDIASGDITTLATVPSDRMKNAIFIAKNTGIISGISIVEYIFSLIDSSIQCHWSITDGSHITRSTQFGYISGSARSLLQGERLVLNIIQRMSGIATQTSVYVNLVKSIQSKSIILDTRKTVPGLRLLDKLSVQHGGGRNHRHGLYDMFMIKDNHISAAGSIENALKLVQQYIIDNKLPDTVLVELEVRTDDELQQILSLNNKYKLDVIMLDNMITVQYLDGNTNNLSSSNMKIDTSRLESAVQLINGRYKTEASGNVNIGTVQSIAQSNVTYISIGALTHSVTAFDISLKIIEDDGTLFNGHTQALNAHSAV